MRRFVLILAFLAVVAGCDTAPRGRPTPPGVLDRPNVEQDEQTTKIKMH